MQVGPRYAPGMVPTADVDLAVDIVGPRWEALRGARVVLTGATGFFGVWLLATLQAANDRHALGIRATVLSRQPRAVLPGVDWIVGDVRTTDLDGDFTHAVLGATAASAALNRDRPLEMFDVIVGGTRRSLERLRTGRVLFVSSGAVYGPQPPELGHVPETFRGGPDPLDPASAYAVGKLAAEHLVSTWGYARGAEVVVARPFAFVGPHLPMDAHFAVGNFVRDASAGRDVVVSGDGTPFRSYLYAAELAAWLWTLLAAGTPGRAYNVGSDEAVSIADLAAIVAREGGVGFRVEGVPRPDVPAARYVPSVARIGEELGLRPRLRVAEGVRRMLAWVRANRAPSGIR
jgi:nucleoside-diphosphate-sugar epimerase